MDKEETKLILTSDDFFDAMKFQDSSPKEQVLYLIYYVTRIAHLRKDMLPRIIADRIHDQFKSYFQRNKAESNRNYKPISTKEVRNILNRETSWFVQNTSGVFDGSDRHINMKEYPYTLTNEKIKELDEKFDKDLVSKISINEKKLFINKTYTSFFVLLIILSVALFTTFMFIFNRDNTIVATSVKEYAERMDFDKQNPVKKSVLFVYYVTRIAEIRNVVEAKAIHGRISEMGYEMPSQDVLNDLLNSTKMLKKVNGNLLAYSLTEDGITFAEEEIYSHRPQNNDLSLTWKEIIEIVISIVVLICSLIVYAFQAGYKLRK